MRTTRTEMVPKEITTYTCDICDWSTENNSGCCGSSPIMQCELCEKDCCRDHRESFFEDPWSQDYPNITVCSDCHPKAKLAWEAAVMYAGRYEIIENVVREHYEKYTIDQLRTLVGDSDD